MITVEIEGKPNLEFPDGTTEDVINATVKRMVGAEQEPQEPSTFEKIAPSIKRTADIYMEEINAAKDALNQFKEKPTGKSAIGAGLGAVRYAFSPLTAFARGIVGEPIGSIPRALGAPEPVSQFVQNTAEGAATMIPYGGLVTQAIKAGTQPLARQLISKAAESVSKPLAKAPLKFAEGTPPELIEKVTTPPAGLLKPIVKEGASKETINAVAPLVKETWNPSGAKRIGQEITDYVLQNRGEIPRVLEKYGLSPEELSAQIKETYSTSGRQLNQLSRLAKQIRKEFDDPQLRELANELEKDVPDTALMDTFMQGWKKVENVRRSLLVSQVATTARNIISQAGRVTLGSVDDATRGAIEGLVSGGSPVATAKATLSGLGKGLDTWTALFHRMTPSGRRSFTALIDSDNALKAKSIMYGAPIQDVTLGNKVTKAINVLNTTQEFFFRNMAFETRLANKLRATGVKGGIKGIDPKTVPPELLEDAAKYSLEMTFAAMPKSRFGQDMVRAMSNPIATAMLNPFPRFLWGNAMPFLTDFSPIGFLKAASPRTIAKLASGNTEEFAKAASRATIGTLMLNAALYARNSEHAGEKWYELRVGDKRIDTRPFAPFSTYLFMAEAMSNPDNIKPADYASALLSLNRIAGTGLVLTDMMRGKKFETFMNSAVRFAGEYLGGFSVPARTFKDIYSAVNPEEAKIRDIRDSELTGPTARNIPVLSQTLPETESPMKEENPRTENPLLRQFTGLSVSTKTSLEQEINKLNADTGKLYPKTGIPEADREVSKIMGPVMEKIGPLVMKSEGYQNASDPIKRFIMYELFKRVRQGAMKQLPADMVAAIRMKRISPDIKDIMEEGISQ